MTTEEKNIAIAEMLGAKLTCYYHNTTTGFKMEQMIGDIVEKLKSLNHLPIGQHILNGIDIKYLKFHSDANWQFEALEYVNTQGYYATSYPNTCEIENDDKSYYKISQGHTRKEAIFEALYQFSQYLKQKK